MQQKHGNNNSNNNNAKESVRSPTHHHDGDNSQFIKHTEEGDETTGAKDNGAPGAAVSSPRAPRVRSPPRLTWPAAAAPPSSPTHGVKRPGLRPNVEGVHGAYRVRGGSSRWMPLDAAGCHAWCSIQRRVQSWTSLGTRTSTRASIRNGRIASSRQARERGPGRNSIRSVNCNCERNFTQKAIHYPLHLLVSAVDEPWHRLSYAFLTRSCIILVLFFCARTLELRGYPSYCSRRLQEPFGSSRAHRRVQLHVQPNHDRPRTHGVHHGALRAVRNVRADLDATTTKFAKSGGSVPKCIYAQRRRTHLVGAPPFRNELRDRVQLLVVLLLRERKGLWNQHEVWVRTKQEMHPS